MSKKLLSPLQKSLKRAAEKAKKAAAKKVSPKKVAPKKKKEV